MKLVITGGSGQLARRAAELVLAHFVPEDLIVTTRAPAALRAFAERGAIVRHADFAAAAHIARGVRGRRAAAAGERDGSRPTHGAASSRDRRPGGRRCVPRHLHLGPGARAAESGHRRTEPLRDGASARAQRPRRGRSCATVFMPTTKAPEATQSIASGALGPHRARRQSCVRGARGLRLPAAVGSRPRPVMPGACYDVTGPGGDAAGARAALYGDLGGRPVTPNGLSATPTSSQRWSELPAGDDPPALRHRARRVVRPLYPRRINECSAPNPRSEARGAAGPVVAASARAAARSRLTEKNMNARNCAVALLIVTLLAAAGPKARTA